MFNDPDRLIIKTGVICPECNVKGCDEISITTTICAVRSFNDHDGHLHEHDSNRATAQCRCFNGHEFQIRLFNSCWCGWKQSE